MNISTFLGKLAFREKGRKGDGSLYCLDSQLSVESHYYSYIVNFEEEGAIKTYFFFSLVG